MATAPAITPAVEAGVDALPGRGHPLPAAANAFFAPRFGFDFSRVRVHTDSRAAETARGLHARAFTVGNDIAFAAGEYHPDSPVGMKLLAHELAHVVQQSSDVSCSVATIQRAADAGVAPAAAAPPGLIIDDAAEPGPGQMRKGEFLGAVRPVVEQAAAEVFSGPEGLAQATPLIDQAMATAEGQTAPEVEQGLRTMVPAAANARTAEEYIPMIAARVREAASGGAGAAPGAEGGGGRVARKAADGEAANTTAAEIGAPVIRARLGGGQPLPGAVRARMESGFGMSFANVRLHTDPAASHLSERLGARAFTVGEHIAFGHGEYRPGNDEGDTLLAHELAHVAQQQTGSSASASVSDHALERDADEAADSVVRRMWKGVKRTLSAARAAGPQLKSRLRIQRATARYRMQNTSGFAVCIYCICARQGEIPEKVLINSNNRPAGSPCPPGLEIDWQPGSCGMSETARRELSSNPCPESTTVCQ